MNDPRKTSTLTSILKELAIVFSKLGATAFGGPAAHVAAIQAEVVDRRAWMSRERLLELYATTQFIPGPNSTELVMNIGYDRAGWGGLIVAGTSFILPAMILVWSLAVAYQQFNTLPQVGHVFAGLQPVVMALIAQALWKLSKSAIKTWPSGAIGLLTIGACGLGVNEVLWLALMGLTTMLRQNWQRVPHPRNWGLVPMIGTGLPVKGDASSIGTIGGVGAIGGVGWVFGLFFKIGLVMYGGGYVLIAFLQQELVEGQHLLTHQQLLDAVSIGQITPGPLFTTATFIGYLLAGHGGAVAGTIGIFLPGFLLVLALRPRLDQVQNSPWLQGFLAGVNPAAWGLMAFVTGQMMLALSGWISWVIAIASLGVLLKYPNHSLWLMMVGAIVGWGLSL